ncbi:uncharacterized protein LOC134699009 [Mytilus trossulus]|uniref:uncharacterized protein LOC134699009 n=1 Tax=Mytilus trossulus TaxID=6551 RepID=UPI0030058B7E
MISLKFGIWLLLLYVQIKDTYCKGKISLKLLEYNNPTGTDAKGDCCDSPVNTPGCTIGTCDHIFKICLLDSISNSNTSNCLQTTEVTTSDQNVVKFDKNQQNVQFVFDTWQGEAPIQIEVFDSNTDDKKNILIDLFFNVYNSTQAGFNQTSIAAVNLNLIGTRSNNPTNLRFSVSVFCDSQYYGSDCSTKCVPTNKCDGHYTCDHQGNKVCLSGWRGTDCTDQVPGSDVDCSVYTNKTEFSTSEWEGMYSCDNKQHSYQIFLNATKPKDTLNIDATVSFRNNTVKVSGTYSSWSKALALQVDTSLLYEGHNLTKISLETREISTSGMIGQLSLYKADGGKFTCIVDPLSLKKAYFDGCDFKGTCVRYGKSKQNYYCCCNDGTIGTSCTKTTTSKTTTTLTTKSTQGPTTTAVESTTTEVTTPIQTTASTTTQKPTTQVPTTKPTTTPKPTTQIPTTKPTTIPSTTQTTTQIPTTKPTTKLTTTPTTTVTTTETTTQPETTSEPTTPSEPSTTSEPRTTHEPTTHSEPTTTSEPSTTPEQTTEPPTMMPTTTPTTTTASTTVTTQPTTVRTTLRPTTPKTTTPTTTPTTTTPKPTTLLTTTQKPTTLMTTTLRPTTPVTVSLSDTFTLNLLMVPAELDGLAVVNTLLNSWIMENKGLLNLTKNNTEIEIGGFDETIAEGLPVTIIRYRVKVKSSVINTVSARRPNDNTLIQQLKIQYNTNQILLYTGSGPFFQLKDSLKFYVHGPGPVESQIKHMEKAILSAHNNTCESSGKCEVTKETKAVIRMREEYVGDDGLEITEITYYIEIFGAVVVPTNYSDISPDNYTEAFKAAGIHTVVYRGLKTLRYRFHYTLFIDGKVRTEDEKDFKAAIENTWLTTFPGYYTGCRDCFAQIVRQEKYLTDKGNEVTALIYYFYFHSILQVPLDFLPPNNTLMVDNIHVRGVDNSTYTLYTSDVYSRYRNSFSLLLEGEEDIPTTSLTDNLQAAFLNYSDSSKTIKVVLKTTVNCIDDQGDLVTDLVFFLMRDGEIVDARTTDKPSLDWLRNWFIMQKVLKQSGKHYMVYNKKGRDIFRMDQSWRINVEGFVMMSDMKAIEQLLIDSVNVTIETANIEVQILKSRMFMEKKSRKLMTALYYVWRVNRVIQEKSLTSTLIRENSIVYMRKHLSMLNYTLYDSNTSESTLFMDYHFELYFKMELSSIELLANFSSQLITALQAKWMGYTGQGLEVHVAFQEKVYIDSNQTEAWRVVFFLTYTNVNNGNKTEVIKSEFSKPITELLLYQTLPWTGLNGLEYKLYTEARSQKVLYKNQHFNILLSREISVFDWKRIETDLGVIWCKHLGCKDNTSVSITITEQEKYVDISGNFYWNLVYFVMEHGAVLDSRRYHTISVTKDMFKWTNQYGGSYEVVVHRPGTMWKFSYGFRLYTDYSVTTNIKYLKEALLRVWYLKGIVSENCKCLQIDTVHQRLVTDITGKTMWELTYFIRINGGLVHSTTWPRIDPALIDISSQKSFKFLTNIDTKLFVNLMSFYSNYKMSKKDITKVERELTTKIVDKNVVYKTCRCVSVKITSQEQVVNSKGEIVWRVNYQVLKNKKTIKPSSIKPINWSTFNFNMTNIHGHKYRFSWGWTDWQKYFHYSYLGGLYVGSWIQPTDYTKFYSALVEYYKQHYKGHKIHIEGLNKTKEYYTSTGEKTWRLPFILTVDGKTVNPPALNTTEFEAMLNFTSTNGKSYKLKTGRHTIDATHIFSFNLNHKVSTTDHDKMKGAVITAWCTEHPGVDPSTVTVDIMGQEELVDKTTGKSSWKLLYTLSVNETKTDKWTSLSLTNSHLSSHLNFTSVTGVPYSTVDLKSSISTSSLHHLYFKSFVATTDFKMVAKKLKTSWTAKLKGMGLDNIEIKFIRQRPMVTETGEKIWSWEYVINMNNSVPVNIPLPELSHTALVAVFKNVTSTIGASLVLVKPSISNIEYNSHFSVYLSSKVTHNSYEEFKKRIIQAWKTKGMNVTIDHMTQEELVDKVDGHSVWRLVYFVKKEGKVVDSRTAVRLNTTIFYGIRGPRGTYRVLNKVNQVDNSFIPYQWTSSVFVNHRFGTEATKKMSLLLKQMVEEKLYLTVCKDVPVDIQFLLDASGSVGKINYEKQKDFVSKFGESFTIGPKNIQIGVTIFSSIIKNQFNMNKYSVKRDLLAAIKNITYISGKTFTDVALQYVGNHSFTKSAGDRENAANVVIVMTDGKSRDFNKTKLEASKLHQAGIQVFVIGIGKGIQTNELRVIASDNGNVFIVDSFDALNSIQSKLKATTCKVSETVTEQTITNVSVEVKRQEEYITSTGERVWKLVYFVKVNGQFVPATSVPGLDIDQLIASLNITGPRGQTYQIVKTDRSMIYNYRNRFSVFFTGKVSETSLTAIQTALLETWNSSSKEYSLCGCLSIANISKENIEEFVDNNG